MTEEEFYNSIVGKENTIRVELYPPWEMAWVYLGNKCVYTGNYWDYHPGCHGLKLFGDFSRPFGFATALGEYIRKKGKKVKKIYSKKISEKAARKKI